MQAKLPPARGAAPRTERRAPIFVPPPPPGRPPRTVQRSLIEILEKPLVEDLTITGLQVEKTEQGLALSGELSDGKKIKGSVYLPTYYIDTSGSGGTPPIP